MVSRMNSEAQLLRMFAGALSPIVLKYVLQLIQEDIDAPVEYKIFSGPNKNPGKVTEELILIAQSENFQKDLISRIRLGTFGIALAVDLQTPIEDALHASDFYDIIAEEVEVFLNNTRIQRILESPSLDSKTKIKQIEPLFKSQIHTAVTRLRNGCYSYHPPNAVLCKRAQNVGKELQIAHKAHNLATQKMHSIGKKAGVNLSGVSAFNVAKMFFFKGGKRTTRRSKKSIRRRKQTRRHK